MGKNLVICCDGTNNQFSSNNTNIVRIVQVARRDFLTQHVYYDPGVGTLPEPGWVTWLGKKISEVGGLAFGAGLDWKLEQAYRYLMDWWEPGDKVFLFGFSRGAYTARVLAGLLYELGLLAHGADNMVPYAMRLFATASSDRTRKLTKDQSDYWPLRDEFRQTFARPVEGSPDRRFPVHFMGLFDTVASVGWVWDPPKYPFTTHNPGAKTVRHAVSIDERRWFFRQNLMQKMDGQDMQQHWFAGCHCDVGGGYADSELWRVPLEWMLEHADRAGLLTDPIALAQVMPPTTMTLWKEPKHESLNGLWWLAEFFPKLCRWPGHFWPIPRIGAGRHRTIAAGQVLGKAALERLHDPVAYNPPNLSRKFIQQVRAFAEVPDSLPYEP